MRQHKPETLLLRIRAETLRLNLMRAHAAFKDLPSLLGQFKDFTDCLSNMHECASELSDRVGDLRRGVVRGVVPDKEAVREVHERLENMAEGLANARAKLTELGEKSFLVQMRAEGETTWQSLKTDAAELQEKVEEIEKDLSGPNAWQALSEVEAKANDHVFNESIELLGGIALRDARLDADICELADALIRSIRASRTHPNVIPGGISSMMMRIERFIRLRFPEWTIWGLPLAAHELWRVSARAQYDNLLAKPFGPEGSKVIEDPTIQQCLGDAFATYFMGPAYALAAITLLFDPKRAQDDLRVLATVSMLRHMDAAKPDAFWNHIKRSRPIWIRRGRPRNSRPVARPSTPRKPELSRQPSRRCSSNSPCSDMPISPWRSGSRREIGRRSCIATPPSTGSKSRTSTICGTRSTPSGSHGSMPLEPKTFPSARIAWRTG